MELKILLIGLLFLAGCGSYTGKVTSPDGKVYKVEQSRPGKISIEDKDVKIEANTTSESRMDRLLDMILLRQIQR